MSLKKIIEIFVPDSSRDQGNNGFNCSYCGEPIREGQQYYCQVLTKEKFFKKRSEIEVIPLKALQLSTWCRKCYNATLEL